MTDPSHADAQADAGRKPPEEGGVKETLISLTISLAVAFTAKAYVLEAFMIPTGSMAPTLRGKHITFHSEQSGAEWDVNTWYHVGGRTPLPVQGGGVRTSQGTVTFPSPLVTDPYSTSLLDEERGSQGWPVQGNKRTRAGDRILVQKYLPIVREPRRWDVTVFKNPTERRENYIKRLLGLPMEELWLCDGDVFVRELERDGAGGLRAREGARWNVQRKPDLTQRSLWRTVYSSEFAPLNPTAGTAAGWFVPPWEGEGWDAGARVSYRCDTASPSVLAWDAEAWPVRDRVAYDQHPPPNPSNSVERQMQEVAYPVSDVRLRAGLEPDNPGALVATAHVAARDHEFACVFDLGAGSATLRMGRGGAWDGEAVGRFDPPAPGGVLDVEFWHFDQRLEAWVEGRRIAQLDYEWDGPERLSLATSLPVGTSPPPRTLGDADTWSGSAPRIEWRFEGSPLTMHRVGLDRDIYYEPAPQPVAGAAFPRAGSREDAVELGPDHFFMCGDNSPASSDGRAWSGVDFWVARQIDDTYGVVNRDLIMGKAFFVYFPAWYEVFGRIPVPDFGQMRAIR